MRTGTLIVGGGLAGLALADRLQARGADVLLIEARPRFGGRIHCASVGAARFDLGPAWFWPGQPRMAALARRFSLDVFEQYARGGMMMEQADGSIGAPMAFSTMAGALRVHGGMAALIDALAGALPPERLMLGHRAQRLVLAPDGVDVQGTSPASAFAIHACRVVLALPARLAAASLRFDPPLAAFEIAAMSAIPTWMAGQAKVLAVYRSPFWRERGLSGDAMSRRGPMVEIHDASPMEGPEGALFGFVGVPAARRRGRRRDLIAASLGQLEAMFGPQAASPISVELMDWADEEFTATDLDAHAPPYHPAYGTPPALSRLWGGRLVLGSTEMAAAFGGFLEGALEAAENVDGLAAP